ncbi:MAG: hypothetical protein H6617_03890 [Bdellovibrionaceae bacterium]|nr:hypothetical protein [Bdellovibrionales bacterium]MCB9253800.1 hypothetical protein [Pseudobdellovibrionaceae bacterium]
MSPQRIALRPALHAKWWPTATLISSRSVKLFICAAILAGLKSAPEWLALGISLHLGGYLTRLQKKYSGQGFTTLLVGTVVLSLIATAGEIWGTSNQHWIYHSIGDRTLPLWVPIAWMGAYPVIYIAELQVIQNFALTKLHQCYLASLVTAVLLGVIGEVFAVNLGVWTYTLPFQALGIPAIVLFFLAGVHTLVYGAMFLFCRTRNEFNPVYRPESAQQ